MERADMMVYAIFLFFSNHGHMDFYTMLLITTN